MGGWSERVMGQKGFFDVERRLEAISAKGDPLETIKKIVLEGARPCRARIRPPAERDGRQDRAHHRHRAGEVQDWDDEPRLQHSPPGSTRADGGCARLRTLTGGVRAASCKRTASVKTVSPWHERCNRSLS